MIIGPKAHNAFGLYKYQYYMKYAYAFQAVRFIMALTVAAKLDTDLLQLRKAGQEKQYTK